jgi:hypothetical protein
MLSLSYQCSDIRLIVEVHPARLIPAGFFYSDLTLPDSLPDDPLAIEPAITTFRLNIEIHARLVAGFFIDITHLPFAGSFMQLEEKPYCIPKITIRFTILARPSDGLFYLPTRHITTALPFTITRVTLIGLVDVICTPMRCETQPASSRDDSSTKIVSFRFAISFPRTGLALTWVRINARRPTRVRQHHRVIRLDLGVSDALTLCAVGMGEGHRRASSHARNSHQQQRVDH